MKINKKRSWEYLTGMLEDLIKQTFCRKDNSGKNMEYCQQIETLYEVGGVTAGATELINLSSWMGCGFWGGRVWGGGG